MLRLKDTPSLPQVSLSAYAQWVVGQRWSRKDSQGNPVETPPAVFWRVAQHIAQAEKKLGGNPQTTAEEFYDLLASLKYLPDSPVFTGSDTPLGQLAGCFVLPILDDMGKVDGGIFDTLRDAALIQQTGGGNGFAFSRLRPSGSLVKSSMGKATGPIGFLRVYDQGFGEIAQGGTRRGANMAVLHIRHPDVYHQDLPSEQRDDFIHSKFGNEKRMTNFNVSVGITDQFMRAVEEDSAWLLFFPDPHHPQYENWNGDFEAWLEAGYPRIFERTVSARSVFNAIIQASHHNGEPGILNLSAANATNPVPKLYFLEATNPCGEQYLGPYESCCLGAINLPRHLLNRKLDWNLLANTIRTATHFHDNVVSVNQYVPAVPELAQAAYQCRRIGVGVMGLADVFYQYRIPYGSPESFSLAAQIMEFIRFQTMLASIELAANRGPFPAIESSIYNPRRLTWQPARKADWIPDLNFGRPPVDWQKVREGIQEYGIRNAAQTVVGPCGTKGTVAEVSGYGCEPAFALAHIRHVRTDQGYQDLYYREPNFEKAVRDSGLSDSEIDRIFTHIEQTTTGSCRGINGVPKDLQDIFVVSADVTPEQHVRMQAALQIFVDNSISKTCNFPKDAQEEDVAQAYFLAWKLGCKGLTIYVTGTRSEVILETQGTQTLTQEKITELTRIDRPSRLFGQTFQIKVPGTGDGKLYVTVNYDHQGRIIEVFAIGAGVSSSIGRFISELLRRGTPAQEVIRMLNKEEGPFAFSFNQRLCRSPEQAIAECIQIVKFWLEGEKDKASVLTELPGRDKHRETPMVGSTLFTICPKCSERAVFHEGGCETCQSCGYSSCA